LYKKDAPAEAQLGTVTISVASGVAAGTYLITIIVTGADG